MQTQESFSEFQARASEHGMRREVTRNNTIDQEAREPFQCDVQIYSTCEVTELGLKTGFT